MSLQESKYSNDHNKTGQGTMAGIIPGASNKFPESCH